jgi:hypothetical protein
VVLEWTTGDTSGIEGYQVIYEDFEQETVAIYIWKKISGALSNRKIFDLRFSDAREKS